MVYGEKLAEGINKEVEVLEDAKDEKIDDNVGNEIEFLLRKTPIITNGTPMFINILLLY